jgi:hypothetical protein
MPQTHWNSPFNKHNQKTPWQHKKLKAPALLYRVGEK